jgi:hypothetical protein
LSQSVEIDSACAANGLSRPGERWIKRTMDVGEFEDLIDRLGEDLSRWPEAQRLAGEALIATSSDAKALLEQARTLRRALAAPPVRAPAGLVDRIVAAAGQLNADVSPAKGESVADSADATQSS